MKATGSRATYANVMATLAFFLALSAGAYAAFHLPKNSVKSKNIVNRQVKPSDLAKPSPFKDSGLGAAPTLGACTSTPSEWASEAPADYGPVGYYRDLGGIVHLSGVAMYCDPPNNVIFTLPPGYRPPKLQVQTPGPGTRDIGVFHGGTVEAAGLTAGQVVWLDGVSFRCGPSGKHGCP